MMIRRHPTDSEYAAIGRTLIEKIPLLLEKEHDVAEQIGLTAFALSINLLRLLLAEQAQPEMEKLP